MITRLLKLPKNSFFLLGPRATGKSTWLQNELPQAYNVDLLQQRTYLKLLADPGHFREEVLALPKHSWVIVDEVQRIPALLNEVHSLMQVGGYQFALSGSSARKLKRGQANLLAGRAIVQYLYPLVSAEIDGQVNLDERLSYGSLPAVVTDKDNRRAILEAYTGTYLKEEIKEEALSRKIDAFARFLEVAALMHAQITNINNVARDARIARATAENYFEILVDTLLGYWLPALRPKVRVKEVGHPKFYFFDCGVVRSIQGRLRDPIAMEERGHLLETLVLQELLAAVSYLDVGGNFFYWRTNDGVEVDFIWQRGNSAIAFEVKSSQTWKNTFNLGLQTLVEQKKIKIIKCYGIYLGKERLKKPWGTLLPVEQFFSELWKGKIF
jgi:predicted AAA+ superfamily ATPase